MPDAGLEALAHRVRPAAGEPEGALVLFHGRGADEHDLFPLLNVLDPGRRLLGVTPRGPLALPPGGAHWYVVREIGYPDPETFHATRGRTEAWLDALARETGIPPARTVIGGFSQGAVMTYALGLGRGRPRPAALVALSGFVPTVDGLSLDLERVSGSEPQTQTPRPVGIEDGNRASGSEPQTQTPLPVAIGHGTYDPVIDVRWGRRARDTLAAAGADVVYREYPLPHAVDPGFLVSLVPWIAAAVDRAPARVV